MVNLASLGADRRRTGLEVAGSGMVIDASVVRWVDVVVAGPSAREQRPHDQDDEPIPERIQSSRPLAEVHRLNLALLTLFEDTGLRMSGALIRHAPTPAALSFAAQQTLDQSRHHEAFRQRLRRAHTGDGAPREQETIQAILTPPLRRFIDQCYEIVDSGSFVEGVTMMNLVLDGMAYPLYSHQQRYWRSIDPYLSRLLGGAFADETRHVAFGARIVRETLEGDPNQRLKVARLCRDARALLGESLRYYVRTFVKLFDAVARRQGELLADTEFAPGRKIRDHGYEEQVASIHASIEREQAKLLVRAGLE
jgi:hypothetical protein